MSGIDGLIKKFKQDILSLNDELENFDFANDSIEIFYKKKGRIETLIDVILELEKIS